MIDPDADRVRLELAGFRHVLDPLLVVACVKRGGLHHGIHGLLHEIPVALEKFGIHRDAVIDSEERVVGEVERRVVAIAVSDRGSSERLEDSRALDRPGLQCLEQRRAGSGKWNGLDVGLIDAVHAQRIDEEELSRAAGEDPEGLAFEIVPRLDDDVVAADEVDGTACQPCDVDEFWLRVAQRGHDRGGIAQRAQLDVTARQGDLRIRIAHELHIFELVAAAEVALDLDVRRVVYLRAVADLDRLLCGCRQHI